MAGELDAATLSAIFSRLPGPSLAVCSGVSKAWRSVALAEVLWQQQCHLLEPHPHLARDDLLPDFGGSFRGYYAWRWPLLRRPVQRIAVERQQAGHPIATYAAPMLPGSSQAFGQQGMDIDGAAAAVAQEACGVCCTIDTGHGAWVQQATLAPSGGLLAFTEMLDLSSGILESRVVVADTRSGRRVFSLVLEPPFPPFYYMWCECGTRLLFLSLPGSNWNGDVVALRALDLAPALLPALPPGAPPRPLGQEVLLCTARPLFLASSPTSTRVLWHGNQRNIGLCDAATTVAEDGAEHDCFFQNSHPCSSQAPQWIVDASGADWLLLPVMHPQPADGEAGVLVMAPLAAVAHVLEAEGSRLSTTLLLNLSQHVAPFCSSRDLCYAASPCGARIVAWCDRGELHLYFRESGAIHRLFPPPHPTAAAAAATVQQQQQQHHHHHHHHHHHEAGGARCQGAGGGSPNADDAPRWYSGSVAAMQWSPDGRRLLFLVRKGGGVPMVALSKNPHFRWLVYDAPAAAPPLAATAVPPAGEGWLGSLTHCRPFNPTLEFLDRYLLFWDQYSRSMRLWDPASSAFCFASRSRPSVSEVSEGANISVQPVPPAALVPSNSTDRQAAGIGAALAMLDAPPPVWLAGGNMASWSWS